MISYTCDICGALAESSHVVDRYRFGMQLCGVHIPKFLDYLLAKLPEFRHNQMEHALTRAMLDVVVMGTVPEAVKSALHLADQKPPQAQQVPDNTPPGIKRLHQLADAFITMNKDITKN